MLLLAGCASTGADIDRQAAVTNADPTTSPNIDQDEFVARPAATEAIVRPDSTTTVLSAGPEQDLNDSSTSTTNDVASTPTSEVGPTTSSPATTTSPATTSLPATTVATSTASTAAPSATLPPQAGAPAFAASISLITDTVAERITHSWREGCPVGLDELRLLTLSHWNYDGNVSTGELVVREDFAEPIVRVFERLYASRFPIQRMELVDVYAGDDDSSMAANNTSAFNCREVAWKPGVWSNHALGTAIDINPLVNPYVSTTRILPPGGEPFADRSTETLGGLYPGDVATQAFADIGWVWGGTWASAKDWQHFSASGG